MRVADPVHMILRKKGTQVWHVPPDVLVFEAMRLMAEKDVGALLVMEGEELRGIISERDYARKVALHGRSSHETRVREIMSEELVTITPECSVDEAMRLMTEHRTRHLPVLCDGKVHGMVSIGDLVNWISSAQNQAIEQLENYIEGKYPC